MALFSFTGAWVRLSCQTFSRLACSGLLEPDSVSGPKLSFAGVSAAEAAGVAVAERPVSAALVVAVADAGTLVSAADVVAVADAGTLVSAADVVAVAGTPVSTAGVAVAEAVAEAAAGAVAGERASSHCSQNYAYSEPGRVVGKGSIALGLFAVGDCYLPPAWNFEFVPTDCCSCEQSSVPTIHSMAGSGSRPERIAFGATNSRAGCLFHP